MNNFKLHKNKNSKPSSRWLAHRIDDLLSKSRQFKLAYQNDGVAKALIGLVFVINAAWIAIHVGIKAFEYLVSDAYRLDYTQYLLTVDGSYPEICNYVQLLLIAFLIFVILIETRQAIYASLTIIFLLALGEDALRIHESVSQYADGLELWSPASLSIYHFSQFFHWCVVGMIVAGLLVYGFVRSDTEDRKIGALFILVVFILGAFSVLVDSVQAVVTDLFADARLMRGPIGIVEDGGEMLTIALALGLALLLARHRVTLRRPA